ncbi:Similar to S.cerevisiae protein YPT31 (Rab family GTPase) [Malassezia sympodialis ATCC 42132]|uniref:Similar to S.cerevisiae protein YPT31 (Rab family GTPase) n=1 Tax=Malassezia sympodialis (strain ATCC 42132) TaxID=1230383 RepID=A0A1M8A389_MALS4|nr:Similar to S.cerevisiae protein YPT31 (Rab family GTPase) [Malassezia sympodialis ATCC 42132]
MAHRLAWDYILKFIIIGDASVGKSSLLVRLTENRFLVDSETTIGIEFGSQIVTLPEGERLKLQIWDTAGSEQFRSITRSYYKGAAGCLIVYDVTERETFEHVLLWLRDVQEQADEHAIIALVGNMADLPSMERSVSTEEGAALAKEHRMLFFETSAKTGQNVSVVFESVAQCILEQLKAHRHETRRDERVDLVAPASTESCCR